MSFFKITLVRSAIGLPHKTRGSLRALGLKRRSQTVFHPTGRFVAGILMRVKEIVRVEEVGEAETRDQMKAKRTPEKGFWIERMAPTGRY